MRYAIISDIHANLTALQSVLSDISKLQVDKIICLGDTLGYGPQPAETLELIYQVAESHLLGNHDAAVCGKLNPIIFSPSAKKAVIKHRKMISEKATSWLESLPLTLKAPSFRCAHGDFTKPGAFRYIISEKEALASFQAVTEQLLFVGHTHLAGIYVIGPSGVPHFLNPCDFILEDDKRYIINPGTVGYPRCGKFESTYCIFDSEERSIIFRHLPFDHVAYNNALHSAGFDEIPWIKVKTADLTLPEVRQRLSFTKPLSDEHHLHETLKKLQTSHLSQIKRYRVLIIGIIALSLGCAAFLTNRVVKARAEANRSLVLPARQMVVIDLSQADDIFSNVLAPLPQHIENDLPIPGWRYILADADEQKLTAASGPSGFSLAVTHNVPSKFILESPLVRVDGSGLKHLRMKGRIRKGKGFKGNVFYQIHACIEQKNGTIEKYKVDSFEVRGRSNEGPDVAAITRKVELTKKTTHVRLRIEADFSGVLEIRQPELYGNEDSIPSTKESGGNIP